jgi:hypothetical protein
MVGLREANRENEGFAAANLGDENLKRGDGTTVDEAGEAESILPGFGFRISEWN